MAITWTLQPEYTYPMQPTFKTKQTEFAAGYVQARAEWPYPKRRWNLHWDSLIQSEAEYIDAFFRDIGGPAGVFDYTPARPISAPNRAGDVSFVTSGSLSSRTYYYKLTFVTAAGETMASTESSIAVAANKLFKLTIPKFTNRSITKARIYVGTSSGGQLQTELSTSGGSWTESTSGLGSGVTSPTSNTAYETVQAKLADDLIPLTLVTAATYTCDLIFEEVF